MKEELKVILDLQELDMRMLRLMRVKRERKKEIEQIEALRQELHQQLEIKESGVADLNKQIRGFEQKIQEIAEKKKKLESHQISIKKVDEFNAMTQEVTSLDREKNATEQRISDLIDKRSSEEELLKKIRESLKHSESSSLALEQEIQGSVKLIDEEGSSLQVERAKLAKSADLDTLHIYERLFRNKRDRVLVPIESRTCSGCHIALTAQHENVVRKGENIVFCEHCSRIHYWQEAEAPVDASAVTKRRRRTR